MIGFAGEAPADTVAIANEAAAARFEALMTAILSASGASPAVFQASPSQATRSGRHAWRSATVAAMVLAGLIYLGVAYFPFAGFPGLPGSIANLRGAGHTAARSALADVPIRRAAADLAHASAGDPAAAFDVAVRYTAGNGLARDYARAAYWFGKAASAGNAAAQYDLGLLYAQGLGVPHSDRTAVAWYRAAATRDQPAAQYRLAVAYAEGRGIPQDFVQAAGWYQRAAEQGVAPAMAGFAALYRRGEGVAASLVDAYAWYSVAAAHGDTAAGSQAALLFAGFSAADKARAAAQATRIAETIHGPLPPRRGSPAANGAPAPVLEAGRLQPLFETPPGR